MAYPALRPSHIGRYKHGLDIQNHRKVRDPGNYVLIQQGHVDHAEPRVRLWIFPVRPFNGRRQHISSSVADHMGSHLDIPFISSPYLLIQLLLGVIGDPCEIRIIGIRRKQKRCPSSHISIHIQLIEPVFDHLIPKSCTDMAARKFIISQIHPHSQALVICQSLVHIRIFRQVTVDSLDCMDSCKPMAVQLMARLFHCILLSLQRGQRIRDRCDNIRRCLIP